MPPPGKEFLCHGRQKPFAYRPGADLFEDSDAELEYATRQAAAENQLFDAGFRLIPQSNLWQKDGIATTGDHVTREGIQAVVAQVAAIATLENAQPVAASPGPVQPAVSTIGSRTI